MDQVHKKSTAVICIIINHCIIHMVCWHLSGNVVTILESIIKLLLLSLTNHY